MFNMIGTSSGRIFMGGDDGALYELLYENERQGLGKTFAFGEKIPKCWKIVHYGSNVFAGTINQKMSVVNDKHVHQHD